MASSAPWLSGEHHLLVVVGSSTVLRCLRRGAVGYPRDMGIEGASRSSLLTSRRLRRSYFGETSHAAATSGLCSGFELWHQTLVHRPWSRPCIQSRAPTVTGCTSGVALARPDSPSGLAVSSRGPRSDDDRLAVSSRGPSGDDDSSAYTWCLVSTTGGQIVATVITGALAVRPAMPPPLHNDHCLSHLSCQHQPLWCLTAHGVVARFHLTSGLWSPR